MQIASIANLAPLAFLACPIGMGLMMWMMARQRQRDKPSTQLPHDPANQITSLEALREQHRRLGADIERLEASRSGDSGSDYGQAQANRQPVSRL